MKFTTTILLLTLSSGIQANVLHWLSQPESTAGTVINGDIVNAKISANGRYVSFLSVATNLVFDDTNKLADLFIKDLQTGVTTLVSTDNEGNQITDYGIDAFSAPTSDGQWIAFSSRSAQLPDGVGFSNESLYVKNLQTGVVNNHSDIGLPTYFSVRSDDIYLSDDAQNVTFTTSNLIHPDAGSGVQIYRKNLITSQYELISVSIDGITGANDFVLNFGDVSDNNRYVVFSTDDQNMIDEILNNNGDNVYLRDTLNGTTTLINRTPNGDSSAAFDSSISKMSVSNAGQVVFVTSQDDLVPGDNNGVKDLFLYDGGVISRINLSPQGNELTDTVPFEPTINGDGTVVFFRDNTTGLISPLVDDPYFDQFRYDLDTEEITQITIGPNDEPANNETFSKANISTNGSRVVFSSRATNLTTAAVSPFHQSLYALNNNSGQLLHLSNAAYDPMTANNGSYLPSISSDQMSVVYASDATNLTNEVVPAERNLYLFDRHTNSHQIIGRKVFSVNQISASGRYVVYASEYFQPSGEIDLSSDYLFLYDRLNDSYTQIAIGLYAQVNNNGQVVFATYESFDVNDQNNNSDVYVYSPLTQAITLVSKNSTGEAVGGFFPDISGSGSNVWITFNSNSAELVPADTNGLGDVFMQRWPDGSIIRASATVAGLEADGDSYAPYISENGNRVVFKSTAQNLTPEDYTEADNEQLIMYDRISQSHYLVTRNDDGLPVATNSPQIYFYAISDSGRYVSYEFEDGGSIFDVDFISDDDNRKDVLLYDVENQSTQIISQYINGNNSDDPSERPKVVEDLNQDPPLVGVVFESKGGDLTGRTDHPGRFTEIILYQQGGDDLNLTVDVIGPGSISGNAGINCFTTCEYGFALGVNLSLVATADNGMVFDRWEVDFGDCNDDSNPCALVMDRNKTITAYFSDPNEIIFSNGFE
ncbi:hypothetical protein OS175_07325 [Marinicella sp. S1101]|uniref:InlB B-repeat-containing protein n=1 Tax=Marinicella marina TaxID=2996016 RepID=UPI002260F77A|nr:hypothetical protein [Marinicella marina]MCX7553685.1 hypothetical protein [Marinicella marina]MDJ1140775.1 hypothetical protein [Marinicella marina]